MSENATADSPDPAEVEPTDNSSGGAVDLDRVEEIEHEASERDPGGPPS